MYLTFGFNLPRIFMSAREVKRREKIRKTNKIKGKRRIDEFIKGLPVIFFQLTLTMLGLLIGIIIKFKY